MAISIFSIGVGMGGGGGGLWGLRPPHNFVTAHLVYSLISKLFLYA